MTTLDDLFVHRLQQVATQQAQAASEKRRQELSIEGEKQKMLGNPAEIDKAVASMADYYSPTASTKRPKGESYGVDTVEFSKDEGDPTRGLGHRMREEFANALASPQFRGVPAGHLLHGLSKGMMETPGEDGKSLLEKAHEFSRMEDSRWWGGVANKKLPGYDAWVADKKIQEKEAVDKESWTPSMEDLATGVGTGAVLGGAIGAVGSGLAGAGAGAASGAATGAAIGGLAGGPPGALLGGGVGALGGALAGFFGGKAVGAGVGAATGAILGLGGELLAAPIKKLWHSTDWYQSKIGSNDWQENAKAMLADVAAYVPGGLAAQGGMNRVAAKSMKGLPVNKLAEGFGFEGKPPAGPGIDLSGERINPAGSWAADGATISRVPREDVPFRPAGLLEEMIPSGELPPPPGGSGTVFTDGPNAPIAGGYTPEIPRLLGAGKGYEFPGAGNLSRAADVSPFGAEDMLANAKLTPARRQEIKLLEGPKDLAPNELDAFEAFKRTSNKSYSELPGIAESSPVLDEKGLFDSWKTMVASGKRPFNQFAVNESIENIAASRGNIMKARQSVAENPAADNVVKAAKTKLVDIDSELSPTALQEVGFEPITEPGVTPLKGDIGSRIQKAKENDVFAKAASELEDGEFRSALAKSSSDAMKSKVAPEGVDDTGVSNLITKVDPDAQVSPKQQQTAVKNVTDFVSGGESVIDDVFAGTVGKKRKSSQIATLFQPGEEFLGSSMAEARTPLNVKTGNGGIDIAREEYFKLLETTPDDVMKDLKIAAKGDEGILKDLVDEQNVEFAEWAQERGFVSGGKNANADKFKLIAGMAAFGLPAGVLADHLTGKEAEAGMWTASASTLAKKAALKADLLKKGLISVSVKPGQTAMFNENFQSGIIQSAKEVIGTVVNNIRSGKGTGTQYSLMSPFQSLEALFKTGNGKMNNPATLLASFVTAGSRNKDNAMRVVQNVLDEGEIKGVPNQVMEAMKPLVPLAAKAAKAEVAAAKLKNAEQLLAKWELKAAGKNGDKYASHIVNEKNNIAKLQGTLEELGGSTKQYHDEWTKITQKLAQEHASVRLSLKLEDPTGTLYPWLPKLNRNEEVAAGKLRTLLDQYQVRLKERKIPTRENFFPHSPHPEMAKAFQSEMDDILGGAPYKKFYSRTQNSRALLPDINYSMKHYLSDIEPRLQNHDFWKTSGWGKVRNLDAIKNNPGLKKAFDSLYNGSRAVEDTWGNTAARRYSEFEAVNKLFLSPSAGLKHLVKMTADIVSVGPTVWVKSLPETTGYLTRKALNKTYGINQRSIADALGKIGVKSERFGRQLMDDYMDSAIMSGHARKYMLNMGIESQDQVFSTAKRLWDKAQDVGSTWISLAELADRAASVSSALQMAGKRGMTAEQAMYGTYDLILKNNFLFNEFNPQWLNNPKIRALLMFQATPFKIFERRFVNAQRAMSNVKDLSKDVQSTLRGGREDFDKLPKEMQREIQKNGFEKVKNDFFNMRKYMREGQSELKANLFIDALKNESDFFGTSVVRQLTTDIATVGAATYAGGAAGLALGNHFFHLPFVSTQSEPGRPEYAVSPIIPAVAEGYKAWKDNTEGEDFLLGSIMRRWLGKYGPLPMTLEKASRLNTNDIPEIYRKGGGNEHLKYLFAIPGKE